MGIPCDDVVIIRHSEQEGEPSMITINCPDKTGLGCDLCRIILFFRLSIVRADVSTDGKWCYILFWVFGNLKTRWSLLKKRLAGACPSSSLASSILFYHPELQLSKPPEVFLLQLGCCDRRGLLYDVTGVLYELELIIKRVKVSTTPDGKVMDLFFVSDPRELLNTQERQDEVKDYLKTAIGETMISCDIEKVVPEITECSQASSFLPSPITEDIFQKEMATNQLNGLLTSQSISIKMDNLLSPAHTLVQISCQDHKGLLYDIMRTLKDYNIQISYGRISTKQRRNCEIDLFIMQADGKKIVAPSKQQALSSRLEMTILQPLKVAIVSRGPDTELLVANPVELSGNGRPLVFHDITLALKTLDIGIFLADIGRHMIGDGEWEVYRVRLAEGEGSSIGREKIEEEVWRTLMGWD